MSNTSQSKKEAVDGGLLDAVRDMNRDALGWMRTALSSQPVNKELLLGAESTLSSALTMLSSLEEDPAATDYSITDARACTALTLNNLACVFRRLGREEAALSTLHQAAHTEETLKGQPSCSTLCNLCTVLVALGRADEGIPVAARCVKLARSLLPTETTPDMLVIALHNYAMAQQHSHHAHHRRHSPATMSEALAESRKALGEAHPTTQMLYSKCGLPPNSPEKRPIVRAPAPPPTRGDSQPYTRPKEAAAVAVRHLESKTDPNALSLAAASAEAVRSSRTDLPSSRHSPVKSPDSVHMSDVIEPVDSVVHALADTPDVVSNPAFTAFPDNNNNSTTHNKGRVRHPNAAALLYAVRPRGAFAFADSKAVPAPIKALSVAKIAEDVSEEERIKNSFIRHLPITTQTAAPLPVSYADIRNELMLERRANDELARLRKRQGAMMSKAPSNNNNGAAAPVATDVKSHTRQETHPGSTKGIFGMTSSRRQAKLDEEAKEEQQLRTNRKKLDDHLRQEHDRRQKLTRLHEARKQQSAVVIQRAFRAYWRDEVQPRRLQGVMGDTGATTAMAKSSRAVVRCARTWLRKTAGRRLLLRVACLSEGGKAPDARRLDHVQRQVVRIQCAFRVFAATRKMKALKDAQLLFLSRRATQEAQLAAAATIQAQYRRYIAHNTVTTMRAEFYTTFVLRLQRVVRKFLSRTRVQKRRDAVLNVQSTAATNIQRLWRGYQGRVRASMVRIRRSIATLQRKENRYTALLSRVLAGYKGRSRVGRMHWRAVRLQREHEDFMSPVRATPPPQRADTPPMSPYEISALDRSEEVSHIRAYEHSVHEVELHAKPVEQRYLDDLLEEHCAPTQTQVIRIRAEEALQRDLEFATIVRIRACILIQRVFRTFIGRIRTCSGAASRYENQRLRAQQASLHRRAIRQKGEDCRKIRVEIAGDLAADARGAVLELRSEVNELAAHVRTEIPRRAVRSVRTRTADAKLCRQMEDELEERADSERIKLRQPPPTKEADALPQPFIKARQQLRLQEAASQ